jgi:predicted HTH transcriptional regulator
MELAVLKTLAAFLNTDGGTLLVGVSDDGTPVGIRADRFPNEDKMSLHVVNIINDRMGPEATILTNIHFDDYRGNRVMVIRCKRSPSPMYVKDDNIERFYIRTGPSTTELTLSQAQSYIKQRFNL